MIQLLLTLFLLFSPSPSGSNSEFQIVTVFESTSTNRSAIILQNGKLREEPRTEFLPAHYTISQKPNEKTLLFADSTYIQSLRNVDQYFRDFYHNVAYNDARVTQLIEGMLQNGWELEHISSSGGGESSNNFLITKYYFHRD